MLIFIKESRGGAWSWETECSLCLCPQLKKQSEVFVARVPGPGPGTAQMATRQPPGSWASTGPWIIMSQDISAKQRLPRPRHCVWGWWWWGASLIKIIWDLLGIGDLFFQLCVNFSELYEESSQGYYYWQTQSLVRRNVCSGMFERLRVPNRYNFCVCSEAEYLADMYFNVGPVFREWDIRSGDESCCAANCHRFTASSHSLEQLEHISLH